MLVEQVWLKPPCPFADFLGYQTDTFCDAKFHAPEQIQLVLQQPVLLELHLQNLLLLWRPCLQQLQSTYEELMQP